MSALAAAVALSLLASPLRAAEAGRAPLVGRVVGSGKPVYLNDRLSTGDSERLQIRLLDGTLFTIGPNSRLVVDEFVYDPSEGVGRVSARVLEGVFQFITGKIGKKRPANMKVRLPASTIGINGTTVMGRVEPGRDTVVLSTGAITVSNDAGLASLARAGDAVTVDAGRAPVAPFRAPATLLAGLLHALAPQRPPDERQGCSRTPKSFKDCVRRKLGKSGELSLEPADLVDFDEIVGALEAHGDAALADALKKKWSAQLEKTRSLYPGQDPPPAVGRWLIRQRTPIAAFVGAGSAEAKAAVVARYALTPAALARLEGLLR